MPSYNCFQVEIDRRVAHIRLSRPEKRNSLNLEFWKELPALISDIDEQSKARVIVLSAEGPHFSSGLDLGLFSTLAPDLSDRTARHQKPLAFLSLVQQMQDALSSLEKCRIPVLAAVQGGCIGGGLDLVTACDIRYATKDTYFTLHETNIGMTADIGTFPRLLKLIPEGVVRELAYTGRKMLAPEAKDVDLVNLVLDDHQALVEHTLSVAHEIASKAPIAVHGCKKVITHARDASTAEGLAHVALWNASMLHVDQIMEAFSAQAEGREGDFVELPRVTSPFENG